MNHAAEHLCCVVILNLFQVSYCISFGERIISFERAETNHDKVHGFVNYCQNNSPMRHQFTLHIICINFQVVFFADNYLLLRLFNP